MRAAGNQMRRGLTLVELLVTIAILVMLIGVTIPLMRSVSEGQQLTQATQQVELLVDSARTAAMANGSAGVIFLRSRNPGEWNRCYQVALAKAPPPYAGEVASARIADAIENTDSSSEFFGTWLISFVAGDVRPLMDPNLEPEGWFIRPGDKIRFNYRGARHQIIHVGAPPGFAPPPGSPADLSVVVKLKHPVPFDPTTTFQFFRAPRQTTTPPTELPNGTFIDLSVTGVELDEFGTPLTGVVFDGGQPMITFGATGNIDKVFRAHGVLGDPGAGRPATAVDATDMQQQMLPTSPRGAFQIDIVRLTGTQETHEIVSLATRRAEINSTRLDP